MSDGQRHVPLRRLRADVCAALLLALPALALPSCGDEPTAGAVRSGASPAESASQRAPFDDALAPRLSLDLSGAEWSLWLDRAATWEQDELFAPPVELASLPVNPPTGGWAALATAATGPTAATGLAAPEEAAAAGVRAVSVPGTVEQFTWDALLAERGGDPPGADAAGDYVGVSWWWRAFDVPASMLAPIDGQPRVLQLQFEAVRQRAEIFLNERLVGYDVVGNTPFSVACGDALHAGRNVLAVRITDPGGNFSWEDFDALRWGEHTLPASHGFGGITGPVRLLSTSAVRIADLAVQNRPDPRAIRIVARVENPTADTLSAALNVQLLDAVTREPLAVKARVLGTACPPGSTDVTLDLTVPGAPLWSPASPRLFLCRAALSTAQDTQLRVVSEGSGLRVSDDVGPPQDVAERRFGFRWFDMTGLAAGDAPAADAPAADAPAGDAPTGDASTGDAPTDIARTADAVLRLNGERIVLRSAISWGFWPGSGMVPTPELARSQVAVAKSLGLNMLNHHRGLAAPGLLDVHDELGLLAYEEPGGYAAHGGDAFCRQLAREKLLRMLERDRSHPSLIIVDLINEETTPPGVEQLQDLAAAHALDPTRLITFTSGWAADGSNPLKLHARPTDPLAGARVSADAVTADAAAPDAVSADAVTPDAVTPDAALHESGWWDYHNAPGPGVWRDEFWKGPDDYRRRTDHRGEIVFWGEEGAIAAPPRLGAMRAAYDAGALDGWDGGDYRAWADSTQDWLTSRGFDGAFPSLDALTLGLGGIAHEYQARMIANLRLGDVTDGYVINGWEDTKLENHSGIVDVFRHAKGDPARLAAANAPLVLVVNLRQSVLAAGDRIGSSARGAVAVVADIGLVNEPGLRGPHTLRLALRDATGRSAWQQQLDADLVGGESFGQMLASGVRLAGVLQPGTYTLTAELRPRSDGAGARAEVGNGAEAGGRADVGADTAPLVTGSDTLLVVDWKSRGLPAGGAFLESGRALRRFFEGAGWPLPPVFHSGLPPLAWVALGDFDPQPRELVPENAFNGLSVLDDGSTSNDTVDAAGGWHASFVSQGGTGARAEVAALPTIDFEWSRAEPQPGLGLTDYTATFTGRLLAPETGEYILHALSDDGVRLRVDGSLLIDHWESHAPQVDSSRPLALVKGSSHDVKLEYWQGKGEAVLKLFWTTPGRQARTAQLLDDLVRRARDDGTRLLFLHHADRWAPLLAERGLLSYDGLLEHGRYWLGGGFFAREHPLLAGLPVNAALGRAWQSLVNYDLRRYGVRLRAADGSTGAPGIETLIGCVSGHDFDPAAALVLLPCGEGAILLNTLDLVHVVNGPPGPADVARTLLMNILEWAARR